MRRLLLGTALSLAFAAPASAGLIHFTSPSGNIDCYLGADPASAAQCIVEHASWHPVPAKPATCHLDWAPFSAELDGNAVHVGDCRGDIGSLCYPNGGSCVTLPYGRSVTRGTIRCTSSTLGVTCRSKVGPRRGFRVSRERVMVIR